MPINKLNTSLHHGPWILHTMYNHREILYHRERTNNCCVSTFEYNPSLQCSLPCLCVSLYGYTVTVPGVALFMRPCQLAGWWCNHLDPWRSRSSQRLGGESGLSCIVKCQWCIESCSTVIQHNNHLGEQGLWSHITCSQVLCVLCRWVHSVECCCVGVGFGESFLAGVYCTGKTKILFCFE